VEKLYSCSENEGLKWSDVMKKCSWISGREHVNSGDPDRSEWLKKALSPVI
jgi:hypothetical protein